VAFLLGTDEVDKVDTLMNDPTSVQVRFTATVTDGDVARPPSIEADPFERPEEQHDVDQQPAATKKSQKNGLDCIRGGASRPRPGVCVYNWEGVVCLQIATITKEPMAVARVESETHINQLSARVSRSVNNASSLSVDDHSRAKK
jgi:hypothetical protein